MPPEKRGDDHPREHLDPNLSDLGLPNSNSLPIIRPRTSASMWYFPVACPLLASDRPECPTPNSLVTMNSRIDELMQRAGPPTRIIIYTEADQGWRFAIHHTREIADGWLTTAPAATQEAARAAAEAQIQQICQRFYDSSATVAWEPPDDNGMIRGHVTTIPGP